MSASSLEPLTGCGIMGILKCVAGMGGVLPMIHGPLSCSAGYRMAMLFADVEPLLPTTAIIDKDLVLGQADRLEKAMDEAFRLYEPLLLIVITTCATAMTGEDYSRVIENYERKHGAMALLLDGSALSGDEIDAAYVTFESLCRKLSIPQVPQAPSDVLVLEGLARSDYGFSLNWEALSALLAKYMGLKLQKGLVAGLDLTVELDCYRTAPKLFISLLWQQNTTIIPAPIGLDGTMDFLNAVASACGVPIAKEAEAAYENATKIIKPYADALHAAALPVGVEAAGWYGYALAKFLKRELGCHVLLSVDRQNPSIPPEDVCDRFLENVGRFELVSLMEEYGCRMVFGSSNTQMDDNWDYIPFFQPVWRVAKEVHSCFGFDNAVYLAKRLAEGVRI